MLKTGEEVEPSEDPSNKDPNLKNKIKSLDDKLKQLDKNVKKMS